MDEFEVSLIEMDLLGAALGLDVRPFPFQFASHGERIDDRRTIARSVHQSLAKRGLIEGTTLAPAIPRLVELFAGGRIAIAMLGTAGQNDYRARAVIDGSTGVVVSQHGLVMRFTPVRPQSVVHTMIGMLPALPAGPGISVTVTGPPEQGTPDKDADFEATSCLETTRTSTAGRAMAERILRRPRRGTGYFAVTARHGGRESAPDTLTWVDTDVGRYAVVPSTGPDGRLHVVYSPADPRRLRHLLSRLVAAH